MEFTVDVIPPSLQKAVNHASTMFNDTKYDIKGWFRRNLICPFPWDLECPEDVPP